MNRVNKILFTGIISFLPWIINSCQTSEQLGAGYTISAELDGLTNGQVILAKLDLATNEQVNIDTVAIEKGNFKFQGSLESPYVHTIFINDSSKIPLTSSRAFRTLVANPAMSCMSNPKFSAMRSNVPSSLKS